MKDWIEKNKDALLITGVGIIATAVTVGVTYKISAQLVAAHHRTGIKMMSMIAAEAGVLDKIVEHQQKLNSIVK